jgi:anti-sigma B factor antagonist
MGGYMTSELEIRDDNIDGKVNVLISGEVDIFTSQRLKDHLYEIVDAHKGDLTIDCANLEYIDSTGLGIFVGTLKKTRQNGGKVIIKNLKDNIRKLFVITGLDRVFEIE